MLPQHRHPERPTPLPRTSPNVILNQPHVILNLFQDNAQLSPVILKQVQDDVGGWLRMTWVGCGIFTFALSASSAPLRESILHAEA